MNRILFNPEIGTVIKDVMYRDDLLFNSKEDQAFEPGMVIEVEEDVYMFLKGDDTKPGLFGFLEEMEPEEAKKYLEASKERLKCSECDFVTRLQSRLDLHMKDHKKEKLVGSLGIPLIGKAQRSAVNISDNDKVKARENAWEEQNRDSGLTEGEGLRNDRPEKVVVMS